MLTGHSTDLDPEALAIWQAELEAELALAWGQLYGRRLDISRQAHIGQDRGQALGDATSIPAELRFASYIPGPVHMLY